MKTMRFREIPLYWGDNIFCLRLDGETPCALLWSEPQKISADLNEPIEYWNGRLIDALLERGEFFPASGSPFQQKVWREISLIPWGELRTYSDIAKAIGQPKSVRAVASACGQNPLPLFIPCHRVVGKNDLGGFNGGVELKQKLLYLEGHEF